MIKRLLFTAGAVLGLLVFAGAAGATTLGVTAPPGGSSTVSCSGYVVGQLADATSTPYVVPAGGGQITQWQTYTVGDTAGSPLTFAVLRPTGGGGYTVVGADTETLPNPLPASNVASYTLATPIQVAQGDTLSLEAPMPAACFYYGGSTPAVDTLFAALGTPPQPTPGEALGNMLILDDDALNIAATLVQTQDARLQTSAVPSATDADRAMLLNSVVTNGGPLTSPITFVDQVPSGLTVKSASTGLGPCAVNVQTVTCTINGLPPGQSVPVNVVVMPSKAGTYANDVSVSVASGVTDPNSANNIASATLNVANPVITPAGATQKCTVPVLGKTPLNVARRVLTDLGCKVRLTQKHSAMRKGLVIGVRGHTGTYSYHQVVTLIVSSGPKPKKKHRAKLSRGR